MKLLPCPFCGQAASVGEVQESIFDDGPQFYYIQCDDWDCYARTNQRETLDEAIKVWNSRIYSNKC